jgi:probable rRNA maturation factor
VSVDSQAENFDIIVDIGEAYQTAINEAALVAAARGALLAEGLGGEPIGVSIEIAGDAEVQRLNREYRGVDRTTDVLSFANEEAPDWDGRPGVVYALEDDTEPAPEDEGDWEEEYDDEADDGPGNPESDPAKFVLPPELQAQRDSGQRYLGDIIISFPQAERQAGEFNNSPLRETQELVIHGVFHLLGYDHEDPNDRELMRAKEEAAAGYLDQ